MPKKAGTNLPECLIATKVIPAEFDPKLISRRALFDGLLGRGCGSSVLSIVATAGSGKSTLMAELHRVLADRGAKTCWLSLDSDDNNPAAFGAYFVCALRSADRTLVESELVLLRGHQVQDFSDLFDQLLRRVSNISSDFAIFIDDFQHISNSQVLSFVNRLITYLPPSVRLVISSRSSLRLDLGRLKVSGLLTEIEQEDLNFDSTKAAEFLQRIHGVELNQSDLNALMASTEGWPTGLQLAALALHRHQGPARDLIDTFSGHDKDLTSYLVESVLRSQPKAVSNFLLATSPLRRMSAELCQAVSGYSNSKEMLAHVERCNLFLISLDRQGKWFRYHHLFAEFLQNELRSIAQKEYQSVCDKAAQWCEVNGHTTEAIQYALDGGRHEKASDLIAEHALGVAQRNGDHYTILDWMRRLPGAYRGRRPEILLSHAWSLAFSRDSNQAIEITNQVLARLKCDESDGWSLTDDSRDRFRLVALVTQAVAEATSDQLENCIERSIKLRATIPESEPFLIAATSNSLSYCYFAKREFENSAKAAADAYLYGHRSGSEYATGWANFLHGLADLELGRLRTAQEHSRRMEDGALSGGIARTYVAGLAALLNAEISTQRCEFEKAGAFVEKGKFFVEVFGPLEPMLLAIRNQARQHAWANNIQSARQILMQGQDLALTLNEPRLFLTLAIEEAVMRLTIGDVAGAIETAQRTGLLDDKTTLRSINRPRGVRDALLVFEAKLLIAKGKAQAALRVLSLMQNTLASEKCGNIGLTVKAVKAIALWHSDRPMEATRELDRALNSAVEEFHAYPIFSAGPELLPVLRAIGEHRTGASSISSEMASKSHLERFLVSLLSGEKPTHEPVHPSAIDENRSWETLTERESQLLRLVEAGLANKQLANELFISEATVKWHLHNIYSKIGVRSRSAATARARELRLI